MGIQVAFGAGDDFRMIGEAEVVVCTKVNLSRSLSVLACDPNSRVLGGDDDTLRLVGACCPDGVDLGLENLVELGLSL